ncbi:MAG: ABC transporter ATP-binding protein [Methanospirillum sp.]|nr:ABC transporter ATP-binding protein [Methanospirillum sp.]
MIRCENLGWDAGEKTVLDGIGLEVTRGEAFGLIGPSGGGKSSLIRIMDLLEPPTRGRLWIDGEEVLPGSTDVTGMRRRMAMVFQRPVAFRMNVLENVAYGLALRGVPRPERRARVADALETVGLAGFEERRASTLSGGELQRISIARCLVTDPEVLFLDEPTANLDPLSTGVIEEVIAGLRRDRGITVVLTTHDLGQGQRLCDRLAVLAGGRLVQTGTPLEVFYRPMSIDVAQFVGAENLVEGEVERMDRGIAFVRAGPASLAVAVHAPVAGPVTVAIRPEEIVLSRGETCRTGTANHLTGRVTAIDSDGPMVRVLLDCGFPLVALIRRLRYLELGIEAGSVICAEFDPGGAHLIPRTRL